MKALRSTEEREREMHRLVHRLETISRLTRELMISLNTGRMDQIMKQYPNMPRERVARKVAEEMYEGGAR